MGSFKRHVKRPDLNQLIYGGLIAVVAVTVVYPFVMLLIRSFTGGVSGDGLSLIHMITRRQILKSLLHTFLVSLSVTSATLAIGGSLAWLVVRTDIPGKVLIERLVLITFMIPAYILGVSWLELFGRNGYVSRFLMSTIGYGGYDLQYYSLTAVAVVLSVHLYPLVFLALKSAFQQHDRSLENAAVISGASALQSFRYITLPLVMPSVASIGLFVFSRSMANFSVPALLALPARKEVLTTHIFSALSALRLQEATILSLLLVILSGSVYLFYRTLQSRTNCVTSSREAKEPKIYNLKNKRWPVFFLVLLFQSFTTILPLIAIILSSLLKRWGLPLSWEYFTLNNYKVLLFNQDFSTISFRSAFMNSAGYGIIAATGAVLIASLTLYSTYQKRNMRSRVLVALTTWPMAFPNIVLAIAAILAWNRWPIRLYGTPWVIIITYFVLFIPICMKQMSGLIERIDPTMMHAARIYGASPIRAFFSVILATILPGAKNGWLLCFLIALREIPIALMLYSSGQETLGVLLFGMQSQSYGLEMTSTLAVVIIVCTMGGHSIIQKSKRSIRYVPIDTSSSE